MPRPPRSQDARPQPPPVRSEQIRAAQATARTAPQEVRLIGGHWKRTPLPVPVSAGLRPTPARVRETLFNWLGQDLSGWRVLDAFAGSGALGLEAASRGAEHVCLLEKDPVLVKSLRTVLLRLKPQPGQRIDVQQADAVGWMTQRRAARAVDAPFDLVFLDPPFDEGLFDAALLAAAHCVPVDGWVYVEAPHELAAEPADADAAPWWALLERQRHGQAGAVHFHLFRRRAADVL